MCPSISLSHLSERTLAPENYGTCVYLQRSGARPFDAPYGWRLPVSIKRERDSERDAGRERERFLLIQTNQQETSIQHVVLLSWTGVLLHTALLAMQKSRNVSNC